MVKLYISGKMQHFQSNTSTIYDHFQVRKLSTYHRGYPGDGGPCCFGTPSLCHGQPLPSGKLTVCELEAMAQSKVPEFSHDECPKICKRLPAGRCIYHTQRGATGHDFPVVE